MSADHNARENDDATACSIGICGLRLRESLRQARMVTAVSANGAIAPNSGLSQYLMAQLHVHRAAAAEAAAEAGKGAAKSSYLKHLLLQIALGKLSLKDLEVLLSAAIDDPGWATVEPVADHFLHCHIGFGNRVACDDNTLVNTLVGRGSGEASEKVINASKR
jgi:hypothetical protein